MNKRKLGTMAMVATMTALLSLAGGLGFAADGNPNRPESVGKKNQVARQLEKAAAGKRKSAPAKPSSAHLAAKTEMVRTQQEQRITHEKRKTAAEALKAERMKVYNAKQAAKKDN